MKLNAATANIPIPSRLSDRPISETGYIVPWFVAQINGKYDFRIADTEKLGRAVRFELCWTCGQQLGRHRAFLVGPMCIVNRLSAEPPSHLECAQYAVMACPFLSKPRMRRNEADIAEMYETGVTVLPAGEAILRNPGVTAIWVTSRSRYHVERNRGGPLFRLSGAPTGISFWAEGRRATTEEIDESINSGLPILQDLARQDGIKAMAALDRMVVDARALIAGMTV